MSFTAIVEFITALPKILSQLQEMTSELKAARLAKESQVLMEYKNQVNETLAKITSASTDAERQKLAHELALRMAQ